MKTMHRLKLTLLLALPLLTGCIQQSMSDQPKFKPLQPTTLFADGRSSRPLEYGTVSRSWRDDPHLLTGKKTEAPPKMGAIDANTPAALAAGAVAGGPVALLVAMLEQGDAAVPPPMANKENGQKFVDQFVTTFPFPLNQARLERGQQRYNVFCSVCHGYGGSGDGMIVKRGFTKPPSLIGDADEKIHHELHAVEDAIKHASDADQKKTLGDRKALLEKQAEAAKKENYSRGISYQGLLVALPEAPVGYYFSVMTNGYGAMPEHATQIPVEDRWAIAGYLRVLQKSQRAKVSELTPEQKTLLDARKDDKHEGGHK